MSEKLKVTPMKPTEWWDTYGETMPVPQSKAESEYQTAVLVYMRKIWGDKCNEV